MAPDYVKRYIMEHGLEKPKRDVRQCLLDKMMYLLPRPVLARSASVFQATAEKCERYLGKAKGQVDLVITSPPYLNRQTYSKDGWLRLWFLGYDHKDVAKQSMETGSLRGFIDAMQRSLRAIVSSLKPGGWLVLVGGRARVNIGTTVELVGITDLCLKALEQLDPGSDLVSIESIVHDSRVMSRGSYFAVHAGRCAVGGEGPRLGEEDILIARRRK
jgi:hypothetical protein